MSRKFNSIYCYGFYLDLIGYIDFQFLIWFSFNSLRLKSRLNIMYGVSFIYWNLGSRCFPFSSFQSKFLFSLRTMNFFHRYHLRQLTFPSNSSIFLITHKCDLSFGSMLPLEIQSQAFVFSLFGGWQGGSGPRGGLLEWECKTDHYSSSIARPQGVTCERECSTNALIYIRPTPKLPHIRRL